MKAEGIWYRKRDDQGKSMETRKEELRPSRESNNQKEQLIMEYKNICLPFVKFILSLLFLVSSLVNKSRS